MAEKIIYLSAVLQNHLWGGNALAKEYKTETEQPVGEAWVVSGHLNGQSKVLSGPHKGMNLNDFYLANRNLFNVRNHDRFPLLIKIIDAVKDLSVQVHPDDQYALAHHNDFGKNECWYILDAVKDAFIIYGLKTTNEEIFQQAIEKNLWDDVLQKVIVKKGEFYNVPAGVVHAIGGGIKILEIQQSSDTTYRLYDYQRRDKDGNLRPLHIKDALAVIDYEAKLTEQTFLNYGPITRFLTNQYFTVDKLQSHKKIKVKQNNSYTILFASGGDATITVSNQDYFLKAGYAMIVTRLVANFDLSSTGEVFIVKEEALDLKLMYLL
ncbi:MAG: class I mannose-6-phosphate isomerase [Acholeplasmataceae bacterium]|jgi:mannose-6-phosphate isomerase|nr:class I mannose-6-phosphate isomerase [Acholeplasmataceae bacterium]